MAKETAKVNTPCFAYNSMASKWPKLDALMSGSAAMRLLGTAVLPKSKDEAEDCYKIRLSMAYIYGAYKRTVKKISGRPFSKNVTIQGDNMPEKLADLHKDIDRKNTAIEEFGRELLETAVHKGLTHILVDYPKVRREDGSTPNLKEERENNIRPYLIHIPPQDLIAWSFDDNGDLDEIRFKNDRIVPDGRWGQKHEKRIQVMNKTGFEIWTLDEGKEDYVLTEEGTHSFGKVPLVTIYLNKTGEMTGESCLAELAEAEEDYYQSYADQRYGLYYGRFPFLAATGLSDVEAKEPIVIGARTFLRSTNHEAKYYWVSHDGEIYRVGMEDIDKIIARMEALGLEPMVQKTGSQTATGKAIDQSNHDSDMQSWVRLVENGFYEAYQIAAEITGDTLPDNFKVDIYNEFSITVKSLEYTDYLMKSAQAGLVSRETYLEMLKRFGVLPDSHSVELEKERLAEQGQSLGLMGLNQFSEEDGDEDD